MMARTEDDREPQPAALYPLAWGVICPDCHALVELDSAQISEDDNGAFICDGPDAFPHCPECDCFIVVRPVSVREAYPDETP